MAYNPDYVNCTICGIVLGDVEDWKDNVVALAGPHWPEFSESPPSRKVSSEEVARYNAEANTHRGSLVLLPDNQEVRPQTDYDVNEESDDHSQWVGKMYVGIHAACENLAHRVMRFSFNAKIRSTGDLWLTLERRCARVINKDSGKSGMHFTPPIPKSKPGEPFTVGFERYYVPSHNIYRYGDDWEGWWDKDPIEIPCLSTQLMENLKPVGEASNQLSGSLLKFRKHIEALPQEIKDQICSFFHHGQIHIECNYLMPISMWKEVFFQIPFLWDLDIKAVYNKTGTEDSGAEQWDWEKITRQVMSPPEPSPRGALEGDDGIWSFDKVGLNVPGGFTNRRRIWQILEDMYPNDVHL
ncbi:hypothetical protein FBEOM_9876 [Fusarium beomiforme]|uniref:Uncharacterized protein n=1 Tax=Fusarium beomiforme TaxID=44412 RepID=A0A9P5ACP1_9HYPO|nr:hypothetical protein FBEOM_9876 [Fusarium beomiforme]